jgi:hypothetical protein
LHRALCQSDASGNIKNLVKIDRLNVDLQAMFFNDGRKTSMSQISIGRLRCKIIITFPWRRLHFSGLLFFRFLSGANSLKSILGLHTVRLVQAHRFAPGTRDRILFFLLFSLRHVQDVWPKCVRPLHSQTQ